jgi:hypothetical protein
MNPNEQAGGNDHGQSESDEALLQKMEQEQLSAAIPSEFQVDGGYDQ